MEEAGPVGTQLTPSCNCRDKGGVCYERCSLGSRATSQQKWGPQTDLLGLLMVPLRSCSLCPVGATHWLDPRGVREWGSRRGSLTG